MILNGREIKQEILNDLKEEVRFLDDKPKLVVIQVGNDESSNVYIKQKVKMCDYIGYDYEHVKLDEDITTEGLLDIIKELNKDREVNGILVQMPLPSHIDTNVIQNAVLPIKDVDGLCDINSGMLMHGKDSLYPCTPYGVMEMLKRYDISVLGKHAVVVGRSNLVGKPMAMLLLNEGATVTVCHSKTIDLASYTKNADILIVATGKTKLIKSDMVKKDAVVIDVGITKFDDKLLGDVDFDSVKDIASYITPVPGGVGPMTVAMLASNVLKAYKMQRGEE